MDLQQCMYVLAQVHLVSLCVGAYIMCACVYAHECLVILCMCHVALDYVLPHIHVCTVCLVVLSALQIWLRDCNEEDIYNHLSYYYRVYMHQLT